MRGVPIMAKGVGGTMLGTDPLGEAIRSDRRRHHHQAIMPTA